MERDATAAGVHAGDRRTARFEAVFAAHADGVFAYARRRTTKEEAEEVVSEAFLTAWRRLEEVPDEPLPWLIAVARNTLSNRRRSDNRRAALYERLSRWSFGPNLADDPGEVAATRQDVLAALASLPAGEREVIELIAWEGLTPADVAIALDIARATVYVRLHRARRRLTVALSRVADPIEGAV